MGRGGGRRRRGWARSWVGSLVTGIGSASSRVCSLILNARSWVGSLVAGFWSACAWVGSLIAGARTRDGAQPGEERIGHRRRSVRYLRVRDNAGHSRGTITRVRGINMGPGQTLGGTSKKQNRGIKRPTGQKEGGGGPNGPTPTKIRAKRGGGGTRSPA
jgi:hypothetical protein